MSQSSQLEVWDTKAAAEVQQKKQSAESAPTAAAAAKPVYMLWVLSHSCHLMQLSSLNLLAVPGRIGDVHVSDTISSLLAYFVPPPVHLHGIAMARNFNLVVSTDTLL